MPSSVTQAQRRIWAFAGRSRRAAINTAATTARTTPVSMRLPNSTAPCQESALAGTKSLFSQRGQVGQPRPELVSLTSPPVATMPMFASNEASARRRMVTGEGRHSRHCPWRRRPPVAGESGDSRVVDWADGAVDAAIARRSYGRPLADCARSGTSDNPAPPIAPHVDASTWARVTRVSDEIGNIAVVKSMVVRRVAWRPIGGPDDARTRDRVVRALHEHGPQSAGALSTSFGLTPAAVRRHLDVLIAAGRVSEVPERKVHGQLRGRGRPAKLFALTDDGRECFPTRTTTSRSTP